MPSRSSTLPRPTEQRLPKSTRKRTVSLWVTRCSASEFPGRRWGDGQRNIVRRRVAELQNEGLRSRQVELDNLMRRAAGVLTLIVLGGDGGSLGYHVDPDRQVDRNAVAARRCNLEGRESRVG